MPAEAPLVQAGFVESFAYVLARVSGAIAFVPLPGFRNAPAIPKIVLALGITLALLPSWPAPATEGAFPFQLTWLFSELALGVTIGVVLAWLIEGFVLAMQVLGLQAGYAYASTIDPTTQADSSTLQVLAELAASLVFVVSGLDREVLRAFAQSLRTVPPGAFQVTAATAQAVIGVTASMIALAVRLALPLVALLIMVDVALALLGRINASLQLLTLAFPAKMLVSMAVLAVLASTIPGLFQEGTVRAIRAIGSVSGPAIR